MGYVLGHLIITHLKLQNAPVLGFAALAINIVALETTRLLAYSICLWDKLIPWGRQHQTMARGGRGRVIHVHSLNNKEN
jgi:hypothetical protein